MIAATDSTVKWLDVSPIGGFRVSHDRGRIRIDQDHLVTFLPQGLACLRARVVKLAGLSDHDGAGTDD